MGKASRGKKERSRERAGSWSAARAARAAHLARAETLRLMPGNHWLRQFTVTNVSATLSDVYQTILNSDVPAEHAWQAAASVVLGRHGMRPPFSKDPERIAGWELDCAQALLERAEVLLVTPAAHAAVMAAAATLEPADTATLDREVDIMMPTALLVLPEPLVLVNRTGSLSDIAAWGWEFTDLYSTWPRERCPGVRITTFMDRDGPVQTEEWRQFVALARAEGSRLPRWIADGQYGMRGDAKLAGKTSEELAELSAQAREAQLAIRETASWRAQTPEVGEWSGGQIEDVYDDFTNRYMFAFWRLAAQGTTTSGGVGAGLEGGGRGRGAGTGSEGVRVISLSRPTKSAPEGTEAAGTRAYQHRFPVRMHKVRQWYPSLQQHRLIWRGPYIKGPADAPLLVGEKAYRVDV